MAFEIEYKDTWLTPSIDDVVMFVIGGDWGKEPTILDEDYVEVLCIRGSEIRDWSKNKGNTASTRTIKKSSLETRQLIEGDILLEISGGGPDQPVGRTVLIDKQALSYLPEKPKVCTNFLRLLRFPKSVESSFINMFFDFFYASGEIVNYQGGSNNLRNLKFAEFSKIKIPLPPLNEQHRIVSKIEELFSELDNGVANLKLAQNQLKVYRQALLKHAFEGKLTEQWRKENNPEPAEKLLERIKEERQQRYEQEIKDWKSAVKVWEKEGKKEKKPGKPKAPVKYKTVSESETIGLPEEIEGWSYCRIGEVSEMTSGYAFKSKDFRKEGEFRVIRMGNLYENRLDMSRSPAYLTKSTSDDLVDKYSANENDILLTLTGTKYKRDYGYAVKIPKGERNLLVNQRILTLKPLINNDFLLYLLRDNSFRDQFFSFETGGVNQGNVSSVSVGTLVTLIPSLTEQEEIVNAFESQFSILDNLEQTIESGLQKSEALRQSILKKAFEGKLVPQDPNDEPASELLKQIQAEKKKYLEEQKHQKKRKPKNTKKMSKELSIEEVLKTSDKPMLSKEVWQKSKHKENIEDFYKELKDIQSKVKEVKKGTESLLSLAK